MKDCGKHCRDELHSTAQFAALMMATQEGLMIWSIAIIVVAMTLAFLLKAQGSSARAALEPTYSKRPLMTAAERDAYERLRIAFPDRTILAQVRLAGFLTPARFERGYNRIAQLTADFVICDELANVTAVVEIDDRSHSRPVQRWRDGKKDKACTSAGLPVIRWQATALPTPEQIRKTL
jgi:very-short-patch-repair endonuclease